LSLRGYFTDGGFEEYILGLNLFGTLAFLGFVLFLFALAFRIRGEDFDWSAHMIWASEGAHLLFLTSSSFAAWA
jgi:hypothetical protein